MSGPYQVTLSPTARRNLSGSLPEAVAAAAYEFMHGPLSENPHRVGKRLRPPRADEFVARRGTYRIAYLIDDETSTVRVLAVHHRRDAYHTN